ncbi:MAG TPA: anti-sigma factor, partial [Actinotalea sp.]|nr:anti-sigma factor [Actinotalea sp.]
GVTRVVAPVGTALGTAADAPADRPTDEPIPLHRTRRRARGGGRAVPWLAATAAAGVLVGAVGAVWLLGRDTVAGASVIAQASLEPLPGWDASGQAHVEETSDGERRLVVTLEGGESEGFHEVWLIDRDVTRLVSLGILEGSSGEFTVPSGLDLDDFAVVDVSDEPLDGDPAHSGDSIIRGVLGA